MVLDLPTPYVGAHFGIYDPAPKDGQSWEIIPEVFDKIRFDAVDVLHVSHFVTTDKAKFEVGVKDNTSLMKRFEYIVKTARSMNPKIKIIAEQMYSAKEGFDNLDRAPAKTREMVDLYSSSVRDFLQTWQNKPSVVHNGKTVSLRIDGYDVDHEGSVIRECTKDVLSSVRAKLNKLTQEDPQKRPFIVGITPAWAQNVGLDDSMADSCDFVHMQRYSGGKDTLPEDYLEDGAIPSLDPAKLTYGIETEGPNRNAYENNTIDKIKQAPYTVVKGRDGHEKKVAGIWTWRLGSNWEFENLMQVWLYNLVHKTELEVDGSVPTDDLMKQKWEKNGGAS